MNSYDSTDDTKAHIEEVRGNIDALIWNLKNRAAVHDASKLLPPEKEAFDRATPGLKSLTYGSPQYKAATDELGAALDHHYSANSHHPQFYENGVQGMSLVDVLEMVADWAAAVKRHDDGDLQKSIEINQKRFGMSDELTSILRNTAHEMGWDK